MAEHDIYVLTYPATLMPGQIVEVRPAERDEWESILQISQAIERKNMGQARELSDSIKNGSFDLPNDRA